MTNTKNTPIEALERAFPLRVLRYRLCEGSGGVGAAPGGEGVERDLQMLEDVTVSLITERWVSQPRGLAGGEPGATGENWLVPGGDESRAERLPDTCTLRLRATSCGCSLPAEAAGVEQVEMRTGPQPSSSSCRRRCKLSRRPWSGWGAHDGLPRD